MDMLTRAYEYKESIISDLYNLISIRSTKDLQTARNCKPMGEGISEALTVMLNMCKREGFRTVDLAGYVGYAEYGPEDSENYIAVLCHLDVVPANGVWTYPPYVLTLADGKLIGRGTLDDKGPAIATLYALKIISDCNFKLKHRIRLIFGTDEESGSQCMEKYISLEKMPICGFSPDADFPIVNAEKGQINTRIVLLPNNRKIKDGLLCLERFYSGGTANMVAEKAEALINGEHKQLSILSEQFIEYCKINSISGEISLDKSGESLVISVQGITAHGMEPEKGIHAGLELAHFMRNLQFDREDAVTFLAFLDTYLYHDFNGKGFNVEMHNREMGSLTINSGIQQYIINGESYLHINLRFPSCGEYEKILGNISDKATINGFAVDDESLSIKLPHFVPESHPLIEVLKNAYREITGMTPVLMSTGGGTYAAHIANSVAFGPLFPGREETAHKADEYIYLEDLIKSVAIYAQAIHDLGNL